MSQIETSIIINLANIHQVWGEQSTQLKDAVRASGHDRDQLMQALRHYLENEGKAASSPSSSSRRSGGGGGTVKDLQQKFYNLAIRTKPS